MTKQKIWKNSDQKGLCLTFKSITLEKYYIVKYVSIGLKMFHKNKNYINILKM